MITNWYSLTYLRLLIITAVLGWKNTYHTISLRHRHTGSSQLDLLLSSSRQLNIDAFQQQIDEGLGFVEAGF